MAGNQPAIQVTGAKELRRALRRMEVDVRDLKAIHAKAGERVADTARSRAPRRSGALADSIRIKATTTRVSITAGSRTVVYAGPIHFGWPSRNIRPQPFMYEALDERRDEVVRDYEQRIGDLVRRVGRETPP